MYDNQKIYDLEIKPLIEQIDKICIEHKIPSLFIAATKIDENHNADFTTNIISPTSLSIPLRNDKIGDCFKIFNGYIPVWYDSPVDSFAENIYMNIVEQSDVEDENEE